MVIFHVLWVMFSWPNGIVVGNLLASGIMGTPAMIHFERKLQKHHKEHMERLGGEK